MALISETFDDGSNGGDPNKKPEELHKNPQEEEENQNEKPREEDQEDDKVENLAPIPRHVPEDLAESIVALIPRCHYPRLSLLSRAFRHVISSDQLFVRRSLLGTTEPVLYALITFPSFVNPSWYILHRSNISLRLSRITTLPPMFPGCTTVTIGHKIYVIGGFNVGLNRPVRTLLFIDCRYHTYRQLRSMKRDRCHAAAGVIDGKIYVVGGRVKRYYDWVEVFDVETETWETVPGPFSSVASSSGYFPIHVVLDNKIYILDGPICLVYDPRQRRWEDWRPVSPQRLFWNASSCVVDDLLYAIVPDWVGFGSSIIVYDPRDVIWRPVKGVDLWPPLVSFESRMVNFGGKLTILGCYNGSRDVVWCVEVSLEKREDGDIWGRFESISRVRSFSEWCFFVLARAVTV